MGYRTPSEKKVPVVVQDVPAGLVYYLNSFDQKEILKEAGAVWNATLGAWVVTSDQYPVRGVTPPQGAVFRHDPEAAKTNGSAAPDSPDSPPPVSPASLPPPPSAPARRKSRRRAHTYQFKPRPGYLRRKVAPLKTEAGFVKPSWWSRLIGYLKQERPVIAIAGPAGNGKTLGATQALSALNIPYEVYDCTAYTDVDALVGRYSFRQDESGAGEVWVDGIVARCFRNGWGLVLNEYDALDPRAALALQSALQDDANRYLTTEAGVITPAGACPILLTLNTFGSGATRMYTGRNTLDAASLDRLTFISTGYESELEILSAWGVGLVVMAHYLGWVKKARTAIDNNGVRAVLSLRTHRRVMSAVNAGCTLAQAIDQEFYERLNADDADAIRSAAGSVKS